MKFGETPSSFRVLFVVVGVISVGLDAVRAAVDYGGRCILDTENEALKCDASKYLSCQNATAPFTTICLCDPEMALKHPSESEKVCIPFPEQAGANCSLFSDPELKFCRKAENTECVGSICACKEDFLQVGDKCLKYAENIDEECSHPEQCKVEGGYCHLNVKLCLCDESTHTTLRPPVLPPTCVAYSKALGDNCYSGLRPEMCSKVGENVICSSSSICACVDGYFDHEGRCVALPKKLGDLCPTEGNGECAAAVDGSICDSATSTCVCNPTSHVTEGNSKCHMKATDLGGTCLQGTAPEHCSGIPGATCNSNLTCICDVNHFQMETECKSLPTEINGDCVIDDHCTAIPNAICSSSENKCTCDGENGWDFSASQGRCWKIPDVVGGSCEENSNCRNVGNTSCSADGVCACIATFVPSVSNRECLPQVTKLNTSCVEEAQCRSGIGEEARCLEGTCRCPAEFVGVDVPAGPDMCLPAVGLNETCAVDAQCWDALGSNAKCDLTSEECACDSDSSLLGSRCHRKVLLDGTCDVNEECVVGSNANAECRTGLCKCKSEKPMQYNGSCYGPTIIGGPCVDNLECAFSINGTVSCSASSVCVCGRTSSSPSNDLNTCSGSSALEHSSLLLLLLVTFTILPFQNIPHLNK